MAGDSNIKVLLASLFDSDGSINLESLYTNLNQFDPTFQRSVSELRKRVAIFKRENRLYEFAATEERIRVMTENKITEIRAAIAAKNFKGELPQSTPDEIANRRAIIGKRPNNGRSSVEARVRIANWPVVVKNPSVVFQLCLPRKNPGDYQTWEVQNGDSIVQLSAGGKPDEKNRLTPGKLPWGKFPRLLLLYLNTRVNAYPNEQDVFLGHSLGEFFDKLELSRQGATYDTFHDQLDRLMRCGLTTAYWYEDSGFPDAELYPFSKEGSRTTYHSVSYQVDEFRDRTNLRGLRVRLSDAFYQSLLDNPLPISLDIVKSLGKSTVAMDIYAMLSERLARTDENTEQEISRVHLENLFGNNIEDKGKFFRDTFKPALELVKEKTYPNINIHLDKRTLILEKSSQHQW